MRTLPLMLAAGALMLLALPASAQRAAPPAEPYATGTVRQAAYDPERYRDPHYCASNTGQRDPYCVVADTGSSTYRNNEAAGWNGVTLADKLNNR